MCQHAQDLGGVRLFVGLLGRPEESLRLLGLRLLLPFVPLLPAEPVVSLDAAGAQVSPDREPSLFAFAIVWNHA